MRLLPILEEIDQQMTNPLVALALNVRMAGHRTMARCSFRLPSHIAKDGWKDSKLKTAPCTVHSTTLILSHRIEMPRWTCLWILLSLSCIRIVRRRPVFLISAIQYSKHGPNLSVLSRACWTWTLMSISSQPPIWLRLRNPSVSHTVVTQLAMWACEDPLASANDQLNHLNQPCSWSCSVISAKFWGNSTTFSLGIHVMFQPSEPRLLWYQVGCAPTMRKQGMGIQRQGLHNLFFKTCLLWATCGNSDWSL